MVVVMVMVNVDLYSAIITKVSNALDTLVSGESRANAAIYKAKSKDLKIVLKDCLRPKPRTLITVRPSVRPPQAGIVSKPLNQGSH